MLKYNAYLRFEDNTNNESKSKIVVVKSLVRGGTMGVIKRSKLFGNEYAFHPTNTKRVVLNGVCMTQINLEINRLTAL